MKKELKKLIQHNMQQLHTAPKNMQAIFRIICENGERVFAETSDGYRIKKYTYADVERMVNEVSSALYARIGATHTYVGLEMENCVEWIVAFWAILRSGNKPYLINCRHTTALANELIGNLKIQFVIGKEKTKLNAQWIDYASLRANEIFEGDFEDEFALSTSATSLQAKTCIYRGEQVAAQILNSQSIIRESKRMTLHYHNQLKQLAFLPFYHVFGLFAVYFWFAFFGRTFVFLRDMAPDTILKTCRKHEVTHIFAVPMLWHTIEDKVKKELDQKEERLQKKFQAGLRISNALQKIFPIAGSAMARKILHQVTDQIFGPSVQFCISGGSYLRQSAMEFLNGIGYSLHNGYGMSEIGITSVELRKGIQDRNLNSIGRPFDCVEYRLGEDGALFVRGDSLCKSMLIGDKLVEPDEWLDTGDLMECQDGYYYIRGRRSDVVIGENGENINPDLLEQHFALSGDTPFSVLGLSDGENEVLSMVVRISPYISAARQRQLMERIYAANDVLPMVMRVRKFYFTTDPIAPETAIKVGRKYLQKAIVDGSVSLTPFSQSAELLEQQASSGHNPILLSQVREIVARVLGIEEADVRDHAHILLDLGATSLQYFEIVSEIASVFAISTYSDKENYRYTVDEFCEYIERYV